MIQKIICKEIDDYIAYCEAHPETINKDRHLLIKNIVKPILYREDVFFNEEMYYNCIRYCETNYYPLFPYQKFVYAFVFMYVNDFPLFSTIIIMMGRGNGKDGFMMPLMNFLQTPLHGIKNYHIDIIANGEDQAQDSFNVVYDMLDGNKKFKNKFYYNKVKVVDLKTRSRLIYNTSNAKTKDGKKDGALLFNEYHGYENYDQINVFTSGLGKIKHPRTFIITTNGYVRGGPLDDLLDACHQILITGDNDIGYFPFLCQIDEEKEIHIPSSWIKANPSLPFLPILKDRIEKEYKEALKFPSKMPEFKVKRLNWPAKKEEAAIATWEQILRCSYSDIENLILRDTPDLQGRNAIIGIDYADIRDFASAGLLFKVDDTYIWRQKSWICKNSPFFEKIRFPFKNYGSDGFHDFEIVDRKSLNVEDIVIWCMEQMEHYDVQKITIDTYRAQLFQKVFEMYGIYEETKQNPYGLLRKIRRSDSVYVLTAPKIIKALTDEKIDYGDSAIMRWYTNNVASIQDSLGNTKFIKIEPKLRKTDGFFAFIHAMQGESMLEETTIYI